MTLSWTDIFIISLIVAVINWASYTDICKKIDRAFKDNNVEKEYKTESEG